MRTWLPAVLSIALSGIVANGVFAQDWPNWRGPNFNGSAEAKNLPVEFSLSKNVKWSASLPGTSSATPVIRGNRVYTTSADFNRQKLLVHCLDRATGKVLWQDEMGTGYRSGNEGSAVRLDERSHYAAPSPATDSKRVVFFFGNGDLAAYSHAGKKLWQRNLQKDYGDFAFQWTFSSSPQLWNHRLYVQILQRDQPVGPRGKNGARSFLLALDPETGQEQWRSERPSVARNESRESYATPIPVEVAGRKQLLIAGGDVITGHDPENGKELWRWGTWNDGHREVWWRLVPSPVVGDGVVLVCAPKRAPVYATKLGGNGELPADFLAWRSEDRSVVTSDVPTPLFYQGAFFVLSDVRKSLSRVDPKSGKVLWSIDMPGNQMYWGSPAGADGKIWCIDLDGYVAVVDATSGKVLARNAVGAEGAEIRGSIAVAHNRLFIRTHDRLLCIGN